jgi:signal transduction histidine kinase
MDNQLLPEVLSRLDIVLIDCSGAEPCAAEPVPAWFASLGILARSEESPEEYRSPFFEHFIVDARDFWGRIETSASERQGRLRSGICVETAADGSECTYELSALWVDGKRLLLCERDPSPEHGQRILQGARSSRIEYDYLAKAQRALIESQAALRTAKDRAEQASAEKSLFLAQVSHELRVPLHSILGYAGIALSSAEMPASLIEPVSAIRAAAGALQALIDDLLDLSRIEAGRLTLESEPFEPTQVLHEALRIVTPLAESKKLRLASDLAACQRLWLRGDAARLRQVVLNLLNNAIKFTAQGAVVLRTAVSSPPPGSELWTLRVEVEDSGIGIAREHHDKLFRPFSQADRAIGRQFGGTGLGLAIAKRLVESMHGEIGFQSEVGHGSCFWFCVRLPRVSPQPLAANSVGSATEKGLLSALPGGTAALPRLRILVAEDNPINRALAVHMLQRLGADVSVAIDGRKAVQAVEDKDFDIVLMDRYMPELDGPDACRLIRSMPTPKGQVPIIATSADLRPSEREQLEQAGMNDCLGKPFTFAELVSILQRWGGVARV